MTKILVYDIEAEELEKIADENNTTVAEVVEMLMAYAEEMKKDNNLKQGKEKVVKYCVCGLGYDKNNCITDYEMYLGDFDTYEEAYEEFVGLQCRDTGWFFRHVKDVYQLLLQLEECEDDGDEINCIDVKNEWWIINPSFEEAE